MCILFLHHFEASKESPYKIIVAFNREERIERKTTPLHKWKTEKGQTIFSGIDGEHGGTWLALTEDGLFAAITNIRELPARSCCLGSRGTLLLDCLNDFEKAERLLKKEEPTVAKFNLVYGNVKSDNFYRFSSDTKESREIRQFPLVVSNFSLATESSKIDHGKVLFGNFIDSIDSSFTEIKTLELLDQMLENTVLDISSVPCNTTVGVDIEQKVSSVFLPPFTIREGPMLGNFGTVSSSIILINWENEVCFYEVSRYPVVKTVVERFVIK